MACRWVPHRDRTKGAGVTRRNGAVPNFIIAGGIATGTSFLSATLTQHPDIYLPTPQRPESNFFHYTDKFSQGVDWWLETWFSAVENERAVGERSSLILTSDLAARRLHECVPKIKIIFCLRNPVERAWANYRFSVLEGLEPLAFRDALMEERERMRAATGRWAEVQPHAYITRSTYSHHLREFRDLFGEGQIHMIKSEALARDPESHLRAACRFLGVAEDVPLNLPADYSSPSVVDPMVQTEMRAYFGDRFPDVIESVRRNADLESIAGSDADREMIDHLRANLADGKHPLSADDRALAADLLSSEIRRLRELVPFDISDWP